MQLVEKTQNNDPQMANQRGPCCGLYALQAVAKALNQLTYQHLRATTDHTNNPNLRREAEAFLDNYHLYSEVDPMETELQEKVLSGIVSLRLLAKIKGITKIGEIFSSRDMVTLANDIRLNAFEMHYQANHNILSLSEEIKKQLARGKYILAPFGVDVQGKPQQVGDRPHWCIIYAWKKYKDSSFFGLKTNEITQVEVNHWGTKYTFNLQNLAQSNAVLQDFPAQTWVKSSSGISNWNLRSNSNQMPIRQVNFPQMPLSTTLRNRYVVVGL
ncbi:MAG: hypothetical protein WBB28_08700 [Crinalium sp.]